MRPVGEPPGAGRRRRRRVGKCLALALVAVLALTACTYSASEPGLFRTEAPVEEDSEEDSFPPQPTNPQLPVAGETIWTSSEGLRVTSRLAVHAVRRMANATILDWSVTPLSAPDLKWGEKIPSWMDLGLSRATGGDVNALLIDAPAGKVYRPLQHRSRREFYRCLCTPLWVAQLDLRIGETRLLQATFPKLPPQSRTIDVSLSTLPVFERLPVTPENLVPTALGPTDLSRAAEDPSPLAAPYHVRQNERRGPPRVHSIQIDAIDAGAHSTSLRWTIRSITDQPSIGVFPPEPPITASVPPSIEVANASAASGLQLKAGNRTLGVRWIATRVQGRKAIECLCTTLGPWATTLREAGGRASVTTVFPALPAGVRAVDVVLPTATTLWRLPVNRAAAGETRLGPPRAARVESWVYRREQPPAGWATSEWPTPTPDPSQLRDYASSVEEFAALPGS
jgi:hypothetical protein